MNAPLSELVRKVAAQIPVEETAIEAVATEALREYAAIDINANLDIRDVSSKMSQRLCALAASLEEIGEAWDNARMDHQETLRSGLGAGGGSNSPSGSTLPPALGAHARAYAEREKVAERADTAEQIARRTSPSYTRQGLPLAVLGQGDYARSIDVRG